MFNLKKISTILILLLIGLLIMSVSLIRIPKKSLNNQNYKAEIHPFSISFYDNSGMYLFKISPFDDYYYEKNLKIPFMPDSSFKKTSDLLKEFDQNKLTWILKKDKFKASYEIENKRDEVYITRILEGYDEQIGAIGQSITFCDSCFLSNGDGLVYLPNDQATKENIAQIQNLNLIPLIFTNNQLPLTSKLVILDSSGQKKFQISISPNEQVYFYENWHVLEIKKSIGEKLMSTQIISFK